jgi:hypothetical protein
MEESSGYAVYLVRIDSRHWPGRLGARALVRWRGGWRWVALLPLLLVVGVVLRILLEVSADPTAHNLWPFEVLAVVVAAGALLGVLEVIRIAAARLGGGRQA